MSRRTPLSVVFCDPEIVAVIQSAKDLDPETTLIGEASYAARRDGRLLGAEMAVPAAEHMAHLLALAIGQELSVHDLLRMPFYHPTLEEGLRTALRTIARELPPCELSELARCGALGVDALE